MEGKPSIRVKLQFHDNPHGADPVTTIEGVLTFPGRGHKGVVKPGQLWDCDVVFASYNYVMIAPRVELEDALDSELGVLRYHHGAREVAHIKVADAAELLRSGQVPAPVVTPRPLPSKRPTSASKPSAALAQASPKPLPAKPAPIAITPATQTPPPLAKAAPSAVSPVTMAAVAKPPDAIEVTTSLAPAPAPAALPVVPPQAASPAPPLKAPAAPVPSTPRLLEDWRRTFDGPEGRAITELLSDRLGITSALPRIEDTIDGQEEILSILRGEAGDMRKSIKDVGAQIEEIRKQTLAWRRRETQDLRGVPKPVPKDTEHPTDEEIEREIVHQLYQKDCWGNKYGQYEKLKRGYNSKASDRQVRAAVERLEKKRWIALYPKDTDQFRLNPTRAEEIYQFLGVPDRAAEQLAEETRDELDAPDAITKRDLDAALENVAMRTDVDRTVATIRQKLSTLEDRPTHSAPFPVAADTSTSRNADLVEIKGLLRGLQGEVNRVKKLAEDTASAQRRLETEIKALAKS